MPPQFVPIATLEQFDGSSTANLPISSLVDAFGPNTAEAHVAGGVLTISWPSQYAQPAVVMQTGDWMTPNGLVYSASEVANNYVPYGQVQN